MRSIEEILTEIIQVTEVTKEELRSQSRHPRLVAARVLFAEVCLSEKHYITAIGLSINRNWASICHYRYHYKKTTYYELFKQELKKWENTKK